MDGIFLYTVNPDSDEPIMLIDKWIGYDAEDGYGIMGDLFQKELLALDAMDKKRIQVWINCPGGSVSEGYNIYNAMLKTKTKVDTYCFGMAASMGGVIFQAGRKRIMADYAWLMYHNPYATNGISRDPSLETYIESLAKMVAVRTGKTEAEIRTIMKKETYIMAEEAFASGLCDEVESSSDYNKKKAMPVEALAFWKESNKVVNSLFPSKIQNFNMKKIAAKLNLNSEASEEAVVTEIENVQNKVTDLNKVVVEHVNTIKAKDEEIVKTKADLDAANKKVTDMEAKAKLDVEAKEKTDKEAKEKAEKEVAEKAKTMIEGFVAEGKIKNEATVIASWTEKAKADLEGVKALIEGLPVNKSGGVSAKITTTGQGAAADSKNLTSVVRNTMANKLNDLQTAKK